MDNRDNLGAGWDAPAPESNQWERKLLKQLATASLKEQKRARRWGIFFKLLTFAYLLLILYIWMPTDKFSWGDVSSDTEHTALVEVKGIISDESKASADNIITGLRDAFDDSNTKGVILRLNTPGGSAVQSGYIYDEIMRLKQKHEDIPVYAVVTDVAASGGYYIASAADEIYVDKASLVGSIGVLMSSFGFVDGLEKLGVERRLLTAGEHKGIMDPFSPLQSDDEAHIQRMLDEIHQQFIDAVKSGRGERLKQDEKIFSGLFWSGETSVKLGLADGLGSSSYVARELIGHEDIVDFTPSEDLVERVAKRFGAGVAETVGGIWGTQAPLSLGR